MSHHHTDLCLCTPLLRLLSLLTTNLDLLGCPLNIAFKVNLGTTGGHQQVENILLLLGSIDHRVMLQQLLTDQDSRILPLPNKRLAINLGTDKLSTVFIDIAKQQGRVEHHECTIRMISISHQYGVFLIRRITQIWNMSC